MAAAGSSVSGAAPAMPTGSSVSGAPGLHPTGQGMTIDDGDGAFARAVRARNVKGGGKGEGEGAGQTLGANE
eukprot:2546060-Pyramimonas_sp.AAC.1